MWKGRASLMAAAAAAVAACMPAGAAQKEFRVRYDISLLGLPVGRALADSRLDGDLFDISGHFSTAGVARLFDQSDGTFAANGRLGAEASRPSAFSFAYKNEKRAKSVAVRFENGRVAETRSEPEPRRRRDWVPVVEDHLADVVDPLSALLVPVARDDQVCNRTIRAFDGETRADLVLRPAQERESFSRATVTCRAQFVPVSGYRKDHTSIAYLRDRALILIGFHPVSGHDLYSPIEATISTRIGTVHIRARPQ